VAGNMKKIHITLKKILLLLLSCVCFSSVWAENENPIIPEQDSSVQKKNPKFAVFLGSNISSPEEENAIAFMQRLYQLKIPYYLVFGSTDTSSINGIDKYTYHDIISAFNKRQKYKPNYYYFKPNKHFICAVLDDTSNFMPSKHGEIPDEQLIWLDKLLKKHADKTALIFEHTPLEAPENYRYSILNDDKYREILNKHQNVILISSGKYGSDFQMKDNSGITHISAPAFSSEHAYQLIRIDYEKNKPKSIAVEKIKV